MDIRADQVKQVYSGRPGCACGCRGNYSENRGAITVSLKKYAAALAEGRKVETIEASAGDGPILFWDNEEGTRTYTIYLKDGVAAPVAMTMGGDPFAAVAS